MKWTTPSTMNINQLLSKPPTNISLVSQTKLPSLQSSTINRMEHPLIMPLHGTTTTNLSNPHEMLPVPLLNQQLLVPLAAFQAANGEPLPLVTAQPDSSTLSQNSIKSPQPVVSPLPQTSALGMNLIVTKANTNCVPLITDSIYSQFLNQPFHIQSKSLLNQNIPVQYILNQNISELEKTSGATIAQDVQAELLSKKIMELRTKKSASEGTLFAQSDSGDNYHPVKKAQDTESLESSSSDVTTEIDSGSLSKVISSLPPGWKIVGLTHLTEGTQPTPVVEAQDNITCSADAASGDCTSHRQSPSHHRCGVPEVVSVDLNIPTTLSLSSDIFDDSLDKKRMENIILPIDLSHIATAKSQHVNSSSNSIQNSFIGSDQCQVKIKTEVDTLVKPEITPDVSQNKFDLNLSKNEWKVIGLTTSSLPPTTTTDKTSQVSNNALPFPLAFSSDLGGSPEDRLTNSRSQKAATILNVPTPKLIQQSVTPLSLQQSTSLSSCPSDEVRWTIVGVTMANTTNVTNGSATTSVSTTKVKNINPDNNVKADCIVTNSQQRPVSSSESKNAPLLSETTQKGIDSSLIKDQWKVVGVTHSTNENHITPIPPINYQIPVPLPQVQQTFPISSIPSPVTTNTSLVSTNPAVSAPSMTGLSGNISALNNAMSFVTPSLLTPPTLGQNNSLLEQQQLLLNLVQNQLHLQLQQQQEEQRQLMMSQIQSQLALQNQIPFVNSMNEWNLVGLLSNIPPTVIATSNQSAEIKDLKRKGDTTHKPVATNCTSKSIVTKEMLVSSTTKTSNKHECSLPDSKKSRQSRSRDIAAKFTKKNTVSHLLKLKRMKMKEEGEDGSLSHSDQEGYEVDKNMKQVKDQMALLSKSDKAFRSRPLHSYAGNRKIFSKSFSTRKDEGKQRISLRSGNQVPMNNIEFDYDKKDWSEEGEEPSAQVPDKTEIFKDSSPPTETRSSARKRKLKIPRKMIADVDYQPFDSSSDSN